MAPPLQRATSKGRDTGMAMKPVKYFVVDAFADSPFKGNPAAVCLLEEERDDLWLQAVAAEFNISETCYLTRIADECDVSANSVNVPNPIPRFHLRWFTPVAEVKLCGHATLAAAHALFTFNLVKTDVIEFVTLSGILPAKKVLDVSLTTDLKSLKEEGGQDSYWIELDFPSDSTVEFNSSDSDTSLISGALKGNSIIDTKKTASADDLFVILPSGESVVEMQPDFDAVRRCPGRGLIISGAAPPDSGFDFFSRFFCPKLGINEDPVCGSAHCSLASYWSKKLGKHDFIAYAASPRGGVLNIHYDEQKERVLLRGKAVIVMEGRLVV